MFDWLRVSTLTSLLVLASVTHGDTNEVQAPLTFFAVDYPPYIMATEVPVYGMDVDVVKAAFAASGVPVEINMMPWNRIVKSIKLGTIPGTISCSKRPYRLEYMLFSDPTSEIKRIAMSKRSLNTDQINVLQDLNKVSVTTVEGWGMQNQLVRLKIPHSTAPTIESALQAVIHRNIDVLYMAELPALYYAEKLDHLDAMKVTAFHDQTALPLHLCVSKAYPNAQQIVDSFNQGLERIKSTGQYESIRQHYLNSLYSKEK